MDAGDKALVGSLAGIGVMIAIIAITKPKPPPPPPEVIKIIDFTLEKL